MQTFIFVKELSSSIMHRSGIHTYIGDNYVALMLYEDFTKWVESHCPLTLEKLQHWNRGGKCCNIIICSKFKDRVILKQMKWFCCLSFISLWICVLFFFLGPQLTHSSNPTYMSLYFQIPLFLVTHLREMGISQVILSEVSSHIFKKYSISKNVLTCQLSPPLFLATLSSY